MHRSRGASTNLWGVWFVVAVGCGGAAEPPALRDAGDDPADAARDATVPGPDAQMGVDADAERDATISADAGGAPDSGGTPSVDPAARGPHRVHVLEGEVVRERRRIPVAAHTPGGVDRAPLVVFLPGFQLTSADYLSTVEHLATHGFVVLRADPPASLVSVDHVQMAADVRAVVGWALEADGLLAGRVDPDRVGLAGHSLGGKVAAMAAAEDPRIGAVFGIDPVNAGNPITGFTPSLPDILPEVVATLDMPVGFVGETTNAEGFGQPCAPRDGNFQQFYAAATGAPWAASWEIAGADHMDFPDRCGLLCGACTPGTADPARVRAITRTLATAFFRRHLLGQSAMEDWLTGPRVPDGVTTMHRP
ncbi:MAG: hypothetical protein NZ898_01935 [Myxococcota bacterium]|nr:hypothetical protein [Myxococcota bacterium]MDW8363050.1 hypothetical protein [Myxococcales bacterium]